MGNIFGVLQGLWHEELAIYKIFSGSWKEGCSVCVGGVRVGRGMFGFWRGRSGGQRERGGKAGKYPVEGWFGLTLDKNDNVCYNGSVRG